MYICKNYSYINKNGIFMRLCELRQKEIINTCTCKSLGCPIDLEFDCATGRINALIVPGSPANSVFFPAEKANTSFPGAASARLVMISSSSKSKKKNVFTKTTFSDTVKGY